MTPLPRATVVALALLMAAPSTALASRGWRDPWRGSLSAGWLAHPRARTPATGDGPQSAALDAATRTLYVTNSNTNTISVLDVSRCTAHRDAGCDETAATVTVGNTPIGLALDPGTRTLYVTDLGDRTVSVLDASRCNAVDASGCGRAAVAAVPVDADPLGLAIDPVTHTVYVGNGAGDTLPVIDGRRCNRTVRTGCAAPVAYAQAGSGPLSPVVDPATRTLYVPNHGDDDGTTVSVIDTRSCNGQSTGGCGRTPPALTAGSGVALAAVDAATHTLYVENANDGTVSVFDGATCNGAVSTGCDQTAATTDVGPDPFAGMAVDRATRTLFVPNGQDIVTAVDTRHCRAGDATGCDGDWPALQAGASPTSIAGDAATGTLYVTDFVDDDVSVLDAAGCNAARTNACRHEAPSAALEEALVPVVDPAVHTVYVTNGDFHKLAMLDTRTCTARHPQGCTPVVADIAGVSGPFGLALDPGTQTLYSTNFSDQDVVLFDPARCNVSHPTGCVTIGSPIPVGAGPVELSVNVRTHAVYVGNTTDHSISAIDGAHCRVGDLSGCAAPARTGPTGLGEPWNLFVDASTDTVYVPGLGDNRVAVIDGAHCCAVKATITVGRDPFDLGTDPATHTLYVANSASGEEPGSVSVVDTRACSARDTSGCGQTPPRVATGFVPVDVTVDSETHRVYTADAGNATMSIIDATTCNAIHPTGCRLPARHVAVGFGPRDAALDPISGTLYVASGFFTGVSLVDTRR